MGPELATDSTRLMAKKKRSKDYNADRAIQHKGEATAQPSDCDKRQLRLRLALC